MTTVEDVLERQRKYNILAAPTDPRENRVDVAATNSTLNIVLQNKTNSSNVWAYISGLQISQGNRVFLLRSDGVTGYLPESPSQNLTPLPVDCAIQLGGPGSSRTVTIPQIIGGRVYLVRDSKLNFFLNRDGPFGGPALVEPSASAQSDTNYYLHWSFAELTFNSWECFANITYVDFVPSQPVSLGLLSEDNSTRIVPGLPAGGLDTVVRELEAQTSRDRAGWNKLVLKGRSGENLRAISPVKAIDNDNSLFNGYYQPYVDAVWAKYANETLNLNTQVQWGLVRGRVLPSTGQLVFGDNIGSIAKPSAKDIFFCDTGAFASVPGNNTAQMGNIVARLAAAFNRSTLLINPNQPDGEQVGNYYRDPITNHYSRIVHAAHPDGRGYTFAYDDVAPNEAANVAGTVVSGNPKLLVVAFGGAATIPAARVEREGVVSVRVPLREIARTGGHDRQLVGFGRRGGGGARRMVRRGLGLDEGGNEEEMAEVVVNSGVDGGNGITVERDHDDDDQLDLEKGMLRKLEAEIAWGAMPQYSRQQQSQSQLGKLVPLAARNKIDALLEKIDESAVYNKYARPVLETLGRLLVATMSLSVRMVVSRAVVVLLLVGCTFLLGFFGHVGGLAGVRESGSAGLVVPTVNGDVGLDVGEIAILRAQGQHEQAVVKKVPVVVVDEVN